MEKVSVAQHHQLDWHHVWDVSYVSSTFDTDPFEPQADGVRTLFPFCVADSHSKSTYVELPYTLPQDHCWQRANVQTRYDHIGSSRGTWENF